MLTRERIERRDHQAYCGACARVGARMPTAEEAIERAAEAGWRFYIALALCPECLRWIATDLRRKPLEEE